MKTVSRFTSVIAAFGFALAAGSTAHACPKVGRFPDFNCDGKLVGVVLGDSLAAGHGDTANNNEGGYVLRAQRKLKEIELLNFGVKGLRTQELVKDIRNAFRGGATSDLADALVQADFIVLDLGRNDRWLFGEPAAAARNLKRAINQIKSNVTRITEHAPLVITAVIMLPNRGSQGPWVKDLNKLILKSNTLSAPADLRFDLVSKRLLSQDQIHPTSKGYAALSKTFVKYVRRRYPKIVAALRTDVDKDGLYDEYEESRFGTDPTLTDTDGDGVMDGVDPVPSGEAKILPIFE